MLRTSCITIHDAAIHGRQKTEVKGGFAGTGICDAYVVFRRGLAYRAGAMDLDKESNQCVGDLSFMCWC
jgi:hypothetical protein